MSKLNNSFQEIWEKIKQSKNIIMSLHSGPDGDSLGSCMAMKYVIERDLGKKVRVLSADELAGVLNNLEMAKDVEIGIDVLDVDLREFDLLIALDTANKERIGKHKEEVDFPEKLFVINIDHHESNNYYGSMNYIDGKKSSNCSILISLFKEMGIKFDKKLSERLLLGICTDTGFFNYGMDLNLVFRDVAFLVDNGADYFNEILDPFMNHQSLKIKKFYAHVIENTIINDEKRFGYSVVSKNEIEELGINQSEARRGIEQIQTLDGLDFVFILIEHDDHIKGSFRSTKRVNVCRFAEALGGGGHKQAAAFRLKDLSLKEAEEKVLKVIDELGVSIF